MISLQIYTGRPPFSEQRDIVVMRHVLEGHRAQQPVEVLPLHLWSLVEKCWVEDSHDRPTASQIVEYCKVFAILVKMSMRESLVSDDDLHVLQTLISSGQLSPRPTEIV